MQVLVRYETTDPEAWTEIHDRHSGERMEAGMRQLQLWREGSTTVWGLYEADERASAEAHLQSYGTLQGGVAEIHWLETF